MPITEEFKDRIEHFSNLPTLPQLATKLIKTINNPHTSAVDVASIVEQDVSLSAKVLRLANSAFYGIPKSVTSINSAVVILGFKVISTLVLSLTVFDMFPEDKRIKALFDRKAFWLHSLSCGIIAKLLTSRINKCILFDPEEAFCAGLLHDIGKIVMEQYIHREFHRALEYASLRKTPLIEAENKILGYNHGDVANWLTARWGLPSEIRFSLIFHHEPEKAPNGKDITMLCHIADWLCYESNMVIDKKYTAPHLKDYCLDYLKIMPEVIEEIKDIIPAEVEKTSVFYTIAKEKRNLYKKQ
ncbi:MAG: HDOD domain-containing protein [Chitinispirillaceae bacterium]|nr:HDOD domain-containing protein [Chitinispirillaceae bacterium]